MRSLRFCRNTWKLTMRFGFTAHAQQSNKETRLIVTSSKNSGQPSTHLTALLPSKDLMNQAPSTEIVGKMGKSWRGHRPGIGCGRSSGLRNYTIAAPRPCQFLTPVHPSQHSMPIKKLIMAGDRGGWMIFFKVAMIVCSVLCAKVIDGTQILWSPYW